MRVITRRGPFHFYGLSAFVLWVVTWLLRLLVAVVVAAVRHPRTTTAVLAVGGLVWAAVVHPLWTVAGVLAAAQLVDLAVAAAPGVVGRRALAWWRSVWVYRRQWQVAMLVTELDRDGRLPRLGRVQCTPAADLVRVRGLLGQRFADWEEAGPMLGHVFGAVDVRVHRGTDRRLTLELARGRRERSWNREGYDFAEDL